MREIEGKTYLEMFSKYSTLYLEMISKYSLQYFTNDF